MPELRQLTSKDVLFIGGETATMYLHTAGLSLLDASDRPGFGYEAFRRHLEKRVSRIPHFRWKLHEVPLGLDLPYWVEDENFSFDNHIRRIAVPSPGDHRALGELVSFLYGRQMDRDRPLWETWFIEGLANGQYATFQKLHHCLMDGQAAIKLSELVMDLAPDAKMGKVDPAIAGAQAGEAPTQWQASVRAIKKLSGLPGDVASQAYAMAAAGLRKRLAGGGERGEQPKAPVACFNADIGKERGFVFGSLPLADIKTVKDHFKVTVNDVVLALVGASLRDYLLARGELPEESLRASIAVSQRAAGDDSFDNKVTITDVTMGTDVDNPGKRLAAIAAETATVKQLARSGEQRGPKEILELFPPVAVTAILGALSPAMWVKSSRANVLVSNVRGSERPTYIGGARIVATYPMSGIGPGMGINVTLVSYSGNVDFGVTVSPQLVPDPWRIVDGLHRALKNYLGLARGSGGRKKPAAARSGSRPRPGAPAKRVAKPRR